MSTVSIYLDHSATSWPKPEPVVRRMNEVLTEAITNAGRSGHQAALSAARLVFQTRRELARLFHAPRTDDVVFVRGCTEALNLVLKGFLREGDRVAVSPMEHNSVMRPLERLKVERNISVDVLPADHWGRLDLDSVRRRFQQRAYRLVVVAHGSNANGIVQDLEGLRDAMGDEPALLVDAAQTAGVLPLDVTRPSIDFLACSVHKGLLGPTGVGACYLSDRHEVQPLMEGGTGSHSESFEHPHFRPDCYEAGTLNVHGIAGTLGALESLADRGLLGEHKQRLSKRLLDELSQWPVIRLVTPHDGNSLCVSFVVERMRADLVARRLEREHGILCRPGLQCAPAAHRHLGTYPAGTVRLSPGWGNTEQQMDEALRALHQIVRS